MKDLTISDVDAFRNPRNNNAFLISSHSATKCKANTMGFQPNSTILIKFKWSELEQKDNDFIRKHNQLQN